MTIQPDQICFGLSSRLDKESFACFLQLAGDKAFADALAERLTSAEIDEFIDHFMRLIRTHLSEDEYHRLFLKDGGHRH